MTRFSASAFWMFPDAASPPYIHHSVPNRSLGAAGRRWFLGAMAATTFGVAGGATALGAWASESYRIPAKPDDDEKPSAPEDAER